MIGAAREVGVPLMVISALRTAKANEEAGGARNSYHLDHSALTGEPGALAFDVAVYGYARNEIPAWWWQMLGNWAEANLGLLWGGRFAWNGEPDVNHFDARRWFT